jgi:hypothetical protein
MSHKNIKNTSLDVVFVRLRRLGFSDTHEKDVVEWSGEALEAIGVITQYEEAVCFMEVKNFQATMPIGSNSIIQLARNNCFCGTNESAVCAKDILAQCVPQAINKEAFDFSTGVPVPIDCFGEPIDEYSLAYYRPFFDLQYEYSPWKTSSIYKNCFSPIRLTNHTFFDTLVCREEDEERIYHETIDEYNIYGGDTLRFSFKSGQVALAYTRVALDKETGYPLIPDNISYITAIVYYIIWKLMEKEYYRGTLGSEGRMLTAEKQWIHYCNQAGNKSLMIEGIDEHQNFLDQRSYVLPRVNRYHGFFGKLGTPENRKYNDPDSKNLRTHLFRGM